ncbi:hypothetical protein [Mycobacterium sp.]|jgi:hypothetical protein|uniref:hypothetical protein n=1 Tax=Mycobacterium sp. TaxID=1785 RepID=UPI003C75E72B
MKKLGFAAIASTGLAALAIGLASPALADGTVALPPGGPDIVYQQNQNIGGANPFTPFGTDPYVPYGVWAH